jgi:hypothetical protein
MPSRRCWSAANLLSSVNWCRRFRLRQEKSWRAQAGFQFVPETGSLSGDQEQASAHHWKQVGRELEWKVSVHWVRVLSKASFLNSARLHDTAAEESNIAEEFEVRPGKAEPSGTKSRSNADGI